MKRLTDHTWTCDCGTSYDDVRGEGQAPEQVYNSLMDCWQDFCPYCGCPVTAGGTLELTDEQPDEE